jgi:predicted DNA-binding protein with PD1-like motif
MKTFRGGTPAELIPFHLDDGEDLVPILAHAAEDMSLGTAAVVMGSGNLSLARLLAAGTAGPDPLGILTEQEGPLAVVSMHGWILANQPEIHLTLSRGALLLAGRAAAGCRVLGSVDGLLLRIGNLRLARLSDPHSGNWTLTSGARPQDLPQFTLQGRPIDLQAVLKVPRPLLERHLVLPIAITGDTLIIATANPRDLFAQDNLRLATGMRIQWLETPTDPLRAALQEVLNWLR